MKKIISITLALIMVFSLFAPSMSVSAADAEYPTVTISGAKTTNIYAADGTTTLYPSSLSVGSRIVEIITPLLEQLALGIVLDDYSEAGKLLYDAIIPAVATYAPDKSGEVTDGSGTELTAYTQDIPVKTENYEISDYQMWYDWRESPIKTAEYLKDYIDMVLEATGEEKVNLVGRCYGGNVIAAYLEKYGDHAVQYVDDVAYVSPSLNGIDFIGALFTGNLYFEDEAVNNFVDYFFDHQNLMPDDLTLELVLSLVELLEEAEALGITMDVLNLFVSKIKDDVLPGILRDGYGRLLSYWAMVPVEQVEDAINFVYGGHEAEYADIIAKIRNYNANVQAKAPQTMLDLDARGLDFYIIVKYNFAEYPFYKGATAQSDSYVLAYRQAFGGYYADCGKVFSDAYIKANKDNKYISPDYKIDASTCLFPETTYFIKDAYHDIFDDYQNQLIDTLMEGEMTVSNGTISQFLTMHHSPDEIVPTEGPDEDYQKEDGFFAAIARFFRAIFEFLKNLIMTNLFPEA